MRLDNNSENGPITVNGICNTINIEGLLLHFSSRPTTCRYVGLPSSLSPPSSHKGLCTFTI